LPAIFVYKRAEDENGDALNEVIDGQQRILTLLGFIGNDYINENRKSEYSKNHRFSLKGLKILRQLNSQTFEELDENFKNKILDFQLYIVEIDENQNPNFDPIDLFIRLNDKPYPIREHSFEMWNSWVNYTLIEEIKTLTQNLKSWFYLKQLKNENDRDRMENEELLTALTFLEYSKRINDPRKTFDVYQKKERLNARVGSKGYISALLLQISENDEKAKEEWAGAFSSIKSFVTKLKTILLDRDKDKVELQKYLSDELDSIFKANKTTRYFRRTIQDFYLMWHLISDLNLDIVKTNRLVIKEDLKKLFIFMKSIPETYWADGNGVKEYTRRVTEFKNKYTAKQYDLFSFPDSGVEYVLKTFNGDEIEIEK
jgi:hypothetical protein